VILRRAETNGGLDVHRDRVLRPVHPIVIARNPSHCVILSAGEESGLAQDRLRDLAIPARGGNPMLQAVAVY